MKKISRRVLPILAIFTICNSNAFADAKEFYYERYLNSQTTKNASKTNLGFALQADDDTIQEKSYTQLIDHHNPAIGTFSQRYNIDESFSTDNNSPIFFYICGEFDCSKRFLHGTIRALAEKFHAKLIALEHRYYGTSIPFKLLTTENLKYLSIEAALEDLAQFQTAMINEHHWTGKWIAFGGSYPGSLAAYYRLKYPQLIAGALASSAPVKAQENFEDYDAHVTKVLGEDCAAKARSVSQEIETAVINQQEDKIADYKKMFEASDIKHNIDFLYVIADLAAGAVQYGKHDIFCSFLSSAPTPLEGYANFAKFAFALLDMKALDCVPDGALNEDPSKNSDPNMRQYLYQCCTEGGYWQNANADPKKSSRSHLIDMAYSRNICDRLFHIEAKSADHVNENFYQPLFNYSVSNIFFTNGSNDPWSLLSLSEGNGNATNPHLSYYMIEGAAHAEDLQTATDQDSEALKTARQKLAALITEWLSTPKA